jgi:hypothetical protein
LETRQLSHLEVLKANVNEVLERIKVLKATIPNSSVLDCIQAVDEATNLYFYMDECFLLIDYLEKEVEKLTLVARQMDGMVIYNPKFIKISPLKEWLEQERKK